MKILAVGLVAGVIAGPAVAVALGWMWREEILASKRERQALTADRYAGKSILDVQRKDVLAAGKGKVGKWFPFNWQSLAHFSVSLFPYAEK